MRVKYVVLRHEAVAHPHFDLMIEAHPGGNLMTWRLPNWPAADARTAEPLQDHRRNYLEYEGEISGGRGRVTRVEAGFCEAHQNADGQWQVRSDQGWVLRLARK